MGTYPLLQKRVYWQLSAEVLVEWTTHLDSVQLEGAGDMKL